uniref:Uncharacterized protein n=1 Tax=Cucumis sativus TaxID=3659 RepID=A0A0A0LCK6_CUCSA
MRQGAHRRIHKPTTAILSHCLRRLSPLKILHQKLFNANLLEQPQWPMVIHDRNFIEDVESSTDKFLKSGDHNLL